MSRTAVQTDRAPRAVGPYSQAMIVSPGALVFTAGQIPIDPATGEIVPGGIEEQTSTVFDHLSAVLAAAGSSLENVIKATVYLKDMNDFTAMNRVYALRFGENRPARTTIEACRLPRDVRIEIECVAEIPSAG
jgi:2-iminobutanoate/2-iminopropanoate deaminase